MNTRLWPIVRKEFLHIFRDPRTLAITFLIPIVQLILLGYAATTDVGHLRTAVLDKDRTRESRALIAAYQASNYFDVTYYVEDEAELARLVDSGHARAGMIIPAGYGYDLSRGKRAQISFVIDGSDPNVATTAFAASQSVGMAQSVEVTRARLGINPEEQPGIDVRPRVWYNPEMKSANFMIPALMGIILQMLTTLLTALAIVREREQGTIEQLIVTPIRPIELVLGKVAPYVALAFFDLGEVLLIGVFWFGVPIRGSLGLLLALSSLFLFTSLGIGLFISTISKTQQEAMLSAFLIMLPTIFLSGFFFPLEAMPWALQLISMVIPLRYLLVIIRGIILKGVGLEVLMEQVVALVVFGVVIMGLASARFRKRLE